jgi:hypothetical protein
VCLYGHIIRMNKVTALVASLMYCYVMLYLLTAIVLSPGGSSTLHIYTQTIRRTIKITAEQHK